MTRPGDLQSPPASAHAKGPSAALLDKVRALDALPRLGALRTLDLKGNDLRVRRSANSDEFITYQQLEWHHLCGSSFEAKPDT